jgi:UDP-glucose 4-epimerase
LICANIENWLIPHIKKLIDVEHIQSLKFFDFDKLDKDIPLMLGFEYLYDFSDLGSLGDLLQIASTQNKLRKIIFLSSYGVYYPKDNNEPFKETDIVCPMNFVGTRAAMLEDTLMYLSNKYELDLTILRMFNVYGTYQNAPFVIPTALESIATDKPIMIGDSKKTRDFLYIEDFVELLSKLLSSDTKPGSQRVYNVGSGNGTSIHELLQVAQKTTRGECEVIFDASKLREEYDYDYAVADISRIKEELDWEPKTSLKEGLALTYQWILGRRGKSD